MSFKLEDLEEIIATRSAASDRESYTAKLVKQGMEKAAKKLGEESAETLIACIKGDKNEIQNEVADLLYHLLVVLKIANIPLSDILRELERRTSQSGLEEKASRLKS